MTDLDERLSILFHKAGQAVQPDSSGAQVASELESMAMMRSPRRGRPPSRTLVALAFGVFVAVVLAAVLVAGRSDQSHDPVTTPDKPAPVTTPSGPDSTFVPTDVAPEIPEGCVALVGSEPWITLFASSGAVGCVAVAEDTVVRIVSKGFDPITIDDLPGGPITLGPDDLTLFGPVGDLLGVGVHRFSSAPVAMPEVWVVPATESQLASLRLDDDGLGPFRLGLTLDEARRAWGGELEIAEGLAPGPRCWAATVPNDPYSPLLVVEGDGGPQSRIRQVLVHRRGQQGVGGISVGMTADEVRSRAVDAGLDIQQWVEDGEVLEWEDEGMTGIELRNETGHRVVVAALLTGVEASGPDAPPSAERVRQLSVSSPDGGCTGPAPWNQT